MTRSLDERFASQARRTPAAVALRCGEQSITYGALAARSDRIRRSLRARGIGENALVAVHLERSIDQVSAVLGILASGAAVLPLPPAFPDARKREILSLAGPRILIDAVDRDGFGDVPSVSVNELTVDSAGRVSSPLPAPEEGRRDGARSADPGRLAFVLGSSGSTGAPKLIARSHGSFFHRLEWTWANHPYVEGEVCCQKAHMTTTHSLYELFEPLLAGVETIIVPDHEVRELERFWEVIREHGVTRILIVPSPLRASLAMPGFEPPPFRVVVIMGEYVSPQLAAETIRRFPSHTHLYSIYGSTEASSTLVCDLRALYREGEELPLGTPISADTRVRVLDDRLRPVGPGGRGRLYIGGPALFTGYYGDPDGTAAVLARDVDSGDLLYDTRDEVELTEAGELRYIGRADHTVKVRGFRVNTQEVESAARTHDGVTSAVVIPDTGPGGDTKLTAFVTPATVRPADLFETLRARLPDYMVPTSVVPLDSFPMTASAKVDRMRLREQQAGLRRTAASGAGSTAIELTDSERRVWEVWSQTLGHEYFGPESSWFEVGGSSLTVFALVHRLRQATGLDRARLNEQTVYARPTIRELARWIDEPVAAGAADTGAEPPVLVRLRSGSGTMDREPLFVIASAGGTLGAYARLAKVLDTDREILGVRDPMIWGGRGGNEGFSAWCGRYVEAIRRRQAGGPYYLCAYSSAGAFGWEIARRLRAEGEEVALLALVEPLALDRGSSRRFGHWALRATWMRPSFREIVRAAGWLRVPVVQLIERLRSSEPLNDHRFPPEEYEALTRELRTSRDHLVNLSRLLELNTDQPYGLDEAAIEDPGSADWLELLKQRVAELTPGADTESIERIAVQYQLQVRTHHAYRLSRYGGHVLLVEPESRYSGILAALIRPYAGRLTARRAPLGEPTERVRELTGSFGGLAAHYRCMRDETFVRALADELAPLLR